MKFGVDAQDDYEDENLYEVSGGWGHVRGRCIGVLAGVLPGVVWGQRSGHHGTEAPHHVFTPGPEPG